MENDLLPSEGGVAIEPHGTKIIRVRLFTYPNLRIYKKGFRRMFYKIYLIQQNTTNHNYYYYYYYRFYRSISEKEQPI